MSSEENANLVKNNIGPKAPDEAGTNFPEKKPETFCRVFCCSNKIVAFKSIFIRRPSSLEPLDGVRAIAVIMVVFMHCALFLNPNFLTCKSESSMFNIYNRFLAHGEIGVDIFFTLSGFLIGYILFREIDKYGKIDVFHFYRSRFLRIWPAMFFGAINIIKHHFLSLMAVLLFINNIIDYNKNWRFDTHLWSVMVEF